MKKRILVPTLILAALLTGSLALAGPGGCGSCDKKGSCNGQRQGQETMTYEQHLEQAGRRLEMMSTVLDLTKEQKGQIETLFTQRWQDNQQLREQMQASRDTMRKTQASDSFDEAEFRAQAAKRAELKTEMMVRKIKFQDELYAVLSPEQRKKADKLAKMMGGKGQRGGMGFGF